MLTVAHDYYFLRLPPSFPPKHEEIDRLLGPAAGTGGGHVTTSLDLARQVAVEVATNMPREPVTRHIDNVQMYGYYLGAYGSVICGIDEGSEGADYRCFGQILQELTNGKVTLVTPRAIRDGAGQIPPIISGWLPSPQEARTLRLELEQRLRGVVRPRSAMHCELLFSEIAANLCLHGRIGYISVHMEQVDGGDAEPGNKGKYRVCIAAQDLGGHIPLQRLLPSLLVTGYSTRPGNLGGGYSLVISLADSVHVGVGTDFFGCAVSLLVNSYGEGTIT